jgi:predicted RNase H-like nuclease
MFVAGVDACRAGWVAFKVEVSSFATSVELLDLPKLLSSQPTDLLCLAIDIPIGLLDCSRTCDKAPRKLLGQPRGTSVFAAPCRAALSATTQAAASQNDREKAGRGLSQQAFGIIPKIKQVDDAIRADCQDRVLDVHPEVGFSALNQRRAMAHNKKTKEGTAERITLLRHPFRSDRTRPPEPTVWCWGGRSAGCGSSRLDCAEMESQRSGICLLTGTRSEESRDDDLVLNDLLKARCTTE